MLQGCVAQEVNDGCGGVRLVPGGLEFLNFGHQLRDSQHHYVERKPEQMLISFQRLLMIDSPRSDTTYPCCQDVT